MDKPLTQNIHPGREPLDIAGYEKAGGYQGLRKALRMSPQQVQEEIKKSSLRGRGGAGFPTGIKWSVTPMGEKARRPKYLVVNADEMEPGTMKDRLLLEGDPHQLIEGTLIAAYAIEADVSYIFLRWAYHLAAARISKAIAEAYDRGYLGKKILGADFSCEMHLHTSAGRYMCGEETGLLDALEGKRATPRSKPPYPQSVGLWGKPTVVNNVETLCCVPHIVNNGADWFKGLSRTADGGTKIYGASGYVQRPGVWELPMGTTAREILEDHAGGMREGHAFRGLLPGGASTNFLLEEHLDVPLDFTEPDKVGSRLGTGTMIIMDDTTCPVSMQISLQRFFAHESCGWCTPCREGLPWVQRSLEAIEAGQGEPIDLEILEHHVHWIRMGHTFCALAPGAMSPLEGALKYFKADFERHITE
ncbi:MAG TPA: NADH-quinone oxidoreductase subunit NuoF, partial [Armatimonadota bacterium]